VTELRKQAEDRLKGLLEIRRSVTESRRTFLDSVLEGNQFVSITVIPYGGQDTVVADFRQLIQKEGEAFEKDVGSPEGDGLLGALYASTEPNEGEPETDRTETLEQALKDMKTKVRDIAQGRYDAAKLGDQRFATHLGKLTPEALDRLDLWFPEDSLKVEYSPTGDGRNFKPIEEGSPGQKTAALLAFLLSYGQEPLILDQPEDDLDNHLIYELIVTQLREVKRRRQVIVVTHNPNIVVNGDAELVVALEARGGETQKECEGSLQEKQVRDTICDVMEGGPEAFDQRYRRISLEGRRVR
jgi:ATPase subunit of ABC transporter with duplicated ATPase domains